MSFIEYMEKELSKIEYQRFAKNISFMEQIKNKIINSKVSSIDYVLRNEIVLEVSSYFKNNNANVLKNGDLPLSVAMELEFFFLIVYFMKYLNKIYNIKIEDKNQYFSFNETFIYSLSLNLKVEDNFFKLLYPDDKHIINKLKSFLKKDKKYTNSEYGKFDYKSEIEALYLSMLKDTKDEFIDKNKDHSYSKLEKIFLKKKEFYKTLVESKAFKSKRLFILKLDKPIIGDWKLGDNIHVYNISKDFGFNSCKISTLLDKEKVENFLVVEIEYKFKIVEDLKEYRNNKDYYLSEWIYFQFLLHLTYKKDGNRALSRKEAVNYERSNYLERSITIEKFESTHTFNKEDFTVLKQLNEEYFEYKEKMKIFFSFFMKYVLSKNYYEKVIYLCIAIESICENPNRYPIDVNIALRVTTVLKTSSEEKRNRYKEYIKLYELRSKIVHGEFNKKVKSTKMIELIEIENEILISLKDLIKLNSKKNEEFIYGN